MTLRTNPRTRANPRTDHDRARGAWTILCAFSVSALVLAPLPAEALEGEDLREIWDIARGGQLYDNWAKALDQELPNTTHPAYPSVGKMSGPVTWRCKECHGWDYKGEDGVYGEGVHYTGIKGLRRMVRVDPEKIEKIIRDETHAYTADMLPDGSVRKLALFVSKGQINMDQYVKRETREVFGNLDRGALFYQTVCVICHGFDGARIAFADHAALARENPKYMGTMANKNPWEVLHKIRNGQPGVGMVSLRMLSIQDQVDVLSYLQTLPLSKVRRRRYE